MFTAVRFSPPTVLQKRKIISRYMSALKILAAGVNMQLPYPYNAGPFRSVRLAEEKYGCPERWRPQ